MIKKGLLYFLLGFSLFCEALYAQELLPEELLALKDKAMVFQITTTVEETSRDVWNAYSSKITVPGRPVLIKLVGDNIVISVQFIPYLRPDNNYALMARSEIWINIPQKGMNYKNDARSIPIEFGEPILYFPLGSNAPLSNPHIELLVTVYRYGEEPEEDVQSPSSSAAPSEAVQPVGTQPRRERREEAQGSSDRNPNRNR